MSTGGGKFLNEAYPVKLGGYDSVPVKLRV
jgi:hypothetical protein